MTRFINSTDLLAKDWRFLEPLSQNPDISWDFHYGRARNSLERAVPRPALGRYRAAFSAAMAARRDPNAVLVSHLPRMSAATNIFRKRLSPASKQIAFAFNFTDLPQGADHARLARGLQGIDEFIVFSNWEISVYSELFGIPSTKFRYLPWAMEPPVAGPDNPVSGQYLCAIGGEGRDYALLARAMAKLPDINMVIVARPHSIAGLEFSDNVRVFTNLPAPQTWCIASDSLGLVVPLKTDTTACGHVTLVGAQLLGIPLLITRSRGVEDYVEDGRTAALVQAQDPEALIAAIQDMVKTPARAREIAQQAQQKARVQNSLAGWLAYFEKVRASQSLNTLGTV
jgi:hypothetical protein